MLSTLNIIIIISLLVITSFWGYIFRGKSESSNDFFVGGKTIPWWVVSFSIIATTTSAATFVTVPAYIYGEGGDLKYLIVLPGFVVGNIIMAYLFVKPYYEENVTSPYEFMEVRLGSYVSQLARILFFVAVILSQAVKLLATAIVFSEILGTSISIYESILIMSAFAVFWSVMGGISTVIWTDFLLWTVFTIGAIIAMVFIFGGIDGGFSEAWRIADAHAKTVIVDLSLDPTKNFTVWVGIFGASIFHLGSYAVDQVVTQRILSCKNVKSAKKAVIFSGLTVTSTILMLIVGIGIFAWYQIYPPSAESTALIAENKDRVFPHFVIHELPDGISGIIIAALFSAGISTLTSALTAVGETTIFGFYKKYFKKEADDKHYLKASKIAIVLVGALFAVVAFAFNTFSKEGLLNMALGVPGYSYGALLGIALLALWRKGSWKTILVGTLCSVFLVTYLSFAFEIGFFWRYPLGALTVLIVVFGYEWILNSRMIKKLV
ncbi:sodium:solute symporter family transporter [Salegentibacter maritimus]|uniref:sodium:solute symporter family transporter n=1 Tax=Salegentibacter maritimus TaxID=2794347 RepID=UPI0018E44268|nr:sodium/solute symporter [Salegentibacter maritimus]MBI6117597.1 sodium/solute symporter [Salegentibacter maritimus]